MQSKTTKVHPAPDENHYINAATRAAVSMTVKEEAKESHQSSTNIHITQTGARTHTQQTNGRAVPNQNLVAARILLRETPVPGIIVDPMISNETRTQLSEWITTGPSGSMTPFGERCAAASRVITHLLRGFPRLPQLPSGEKD